MPQACTLTRTWPRLGDGISRSTISKSPPAFGTCATFIFAICVLPLRKSMRDRLFDAAEKVAGYTNFRWHFSVKSGSQVFRSPSAQEGLPLLERACDVSACGQTERIRILATRSCDNPAGG